MVKRGVSQAAHWWSGWRFGLPSRHAGPDFADLGTAFGLDARLDADPVARTDSRLWPWADSATAPPAAEPTPRHR